jgi:hypothetical protein
MTTASGLSDAESGWPDCGGRKSKRTLAEYWTVCRSLRPTACDIRGLHAPLPSGRSRQYVKCLARRPTVATCISPLRRD